MIVNFEELPDIRAKHLNQTIAFGGGCFDLLHEGHVEYLQFSAQQADILVVGVASDERVAERKGPGRPIRPELGRLAVVDAIKGVDYSFISPRTSEDGISPTMQVLTTLKPDVYVEIIEYAKIWEKDLDLLELMGVKIIFDESPKINSTTTILDGIKQLEPSRNEA